MSKNDGDRAFTAESLYGTRWESAYAGAQSFLRRRYTRELAGVDVAVLGVPFDLATSNRPGARFGPGAIRRASAQLAWGEVWPWGFDPFERLAVVDRGDVAYHWGQADEMLANVEAQAGEVLAAGCALLALGGDHFVTLPLLRAHAKAHGPLALVHFDAHTDTGEGSHCDHGTMFRHAAREGLIDPEASVQVGIRTAYDAAHAFHVLTAPQVHEKAPAGPPRRSPASSAPARPTSPSTSTAWTRPSRPAPARRWWAASPRRRRSPSCARWAASIWSAWTWWRWPPSTTWARSRHWPPPPWRWNTSACWPPRRRNGGNPKGP